VENVFGGEASPQNVRADGSTEVFVTGQEMSRVVWKKGDRHRGSHFFGSAALTWATESVPFFSTPPD